MGWRGERRPAFALRLSGEGIQCTRRCRGVRACVFTSPKRKRGLDCYPSLALRACREMSFLQYGNGRLLQRLPHRRRVTVLQSGTLDEQDHEQVLRRVEPTLRAERAAVAVAARREHAGHALRLADDRPAVTEAHTVHE